MKEVDAWVVTDEKNYYNVMMSEPSSMRVAQLQEATKLKLKVKKCKILYD